MGVEKSPRGRAFGAVEPRLVRKEAEVNEFVDVGLSGVE